MVDPTVTRDPNDMGEEERIAEMGKPKLGDIDKVRVTIKESTEFKVCINFHRQRIELFQYFLATFVVVANVFVLQIDCVNR